MSPRVAMVCVHGFGSSPAVWSRFTALVAADPELRGVAAHRFGYRTPLMALHPLRRVPSLDTVADALRTYLRVNVPDAERLALVSHSQGGLVAQRMLAQMIADGEDAELARVRLVVMFACPHAGSDLGLSLRRLAFFWRHPQERELRPLRASVAAAQRRVLHRLAGHPAAPRLVAYAGESDRVVPPASARSVFQDGGTLPGDHFSIVQPDSPEHPSYAALRAHLRAVLTDPDHGDRGATAAVPQQRAAATGPAEPAGTDGPPPYHRLVDQLLAVPGVHDPTFRQQLYQLLPEPVRQQLPRAAVPRTELVGMLMTVHDYRHLGAWQALAAALPALVPEHPAVAALLSTLAAHGLATPDGD